MYDKKKNMLVVNNVKKDSHSLKQYSMVTNLVFNICPLISLHFNFKIIQYISNYTNQLLKRHTIKKWLSEFNPIAISIYYFSGSYLILKALLIFFI